jgi:hypothetical protein
MSPRRLTRCRTLALAGVLVLAGQTALISTAAMAQFLPGPGQSQQFPPGASPFPPPPGPGGQQAAPGASPFPPPPGPGGQQAAPGASPFPPPGSGGRQAAPSGAFPPPSGNQQVCATFPGIRDAAEKSMMAIQAASERKASREEVCPLFRTFAVREARLVNFLAKNQATCGVPPQAVKEARANHARTIQIRNQVCAAGPSAPSGPSLSDALGGPIIADDTSVKRGHGTFDTLTGNPLAR